MRLAGRLTGAIEVLEQFHAHHVPLKTCLSDWGRQHRFAGSKDRSWIGDLCHDALRQRSSLTARMKSEAPRSLAIGVLKFIWEWPKDKIAEALSEEPYGHGALTPEEEALLETPVSEDELSWHQAGDFPDWIEQRSLPKSEDVIAEGKALAKRAPVDLRVNELKSTQEKSLKALSLFKTEESAILQNALRVPATKQDEKKPALEATPAFAKGWIEVQDLGSQIVALAAGDVSGRQVLDYCAGGGGKSLALSALSANTGQIYAWDIDGRRLAPIFDRIKKAGTRNVQVRSPLENAALEDLQDQMDVVFVDAPCSGSGTWRRKPDAKWRLSKEQVEKRMSQQDEVLEKAASFTKKGGAIVYVTCSFLREENHDRVSAFLEKNSNFRPVCPIERMKQTGQLLEGAEEKLRAFQEEHLALQLTPDRTDTDGFYVAVLEREN